MEKEGRDGGKFNTMFVRSLLHQNVTAAFALDSVLLHGCKMAIARFLDRMGLAPRASGLWLRYATLQNLIPFLSLDQILPSGNLVNTK